MPLPQISISSQNNLGYSYSFFHMNFNIVYSSSLIRFLFMTTEYLSLLLFSV